MTLTDVSDLTDRQERRLARILQVALAGVLVVGAFEANVGVVVNASGALAVSFLPALLRREYNLHLDPGVLLLITLAVLLHAVGTLGPYRTTSWWDTLTHTVSGFVVTGIGYAVVRAIDRHVEAVDLPDRFLPVFLLVFALATGVLWELIEFAATGIGSLTGGGSVLVIYGVGDTVTDLAFTLVGGVVLALLGTPYFRGLGGKLAAAFGR